jgi:hypothetical protein
LGLNKEREKTRQEKGKQRWKEKRTNEEKYTYKKEKQDRTK